MATCARQRGRHDDAASNDERKQTSSRTGEWRTNKKRHILGALGILSDIYTILLCKTYGQNVGVGCIFGFRLPCLGHMLKLWAGRQPLVGAFLVSWTECVFPRCRLPLLTRCLAHMWSEGTCIFFSWCPCFGFMCNSGIDEETCIFEAGTLTGMTRQARMRATACLDNGFAFTRNPSTRRQLTDSGEEGDEGGVGGFAEHEQDGMD
ncbi:hypothetical protein B0J13DRAFT_304354 [Dactylonectria estremocensis]|uniref:Uncharacterized protein n=1 Tax=Dactylonectria estremocensis TaxID=1079267 RepID=A0A9P9F0A7_9HYPO|nr:hypothetical protein B0J13DRAFT_304354 [Dactylonectria estremocensis]